MAINCFGHKTTADSKKGLSNNVETLRPQNVLKWTENILWTKLFLLIEPNRLILKL